MEIVTSQDLNIFLQLLVALVLGGLLGAERSVARKTAGMRTYALVSMGAALFVIVGQVVYQQYAGVTNADPLRMASQVVVGIGFIGAGLIIFRGSTVSGLTTAAGLWVSAGIGIAVGFGMYAVAVFATILSLIILTALWPIEQKVKQISEEVRDGNGKK